MKPPKNELDILTQACESLSYRASVVHQWLHPIVQSSAAAKNAYAFKTRVKSSRDIRNKVQGRRNHEDPGKRKPDYKPDDVTDACGFRIVKLFNAEVPQALNELLSLLRTELAPGQLNGRLKNGVGVREIEFHTSRRLNDPLSIYNDVVQVVDNHRFQLAATGEQKVGSSYSSVHVLVDCEIGDEGSQVTGCCEIQLRSVFEEAWGEISHRLRYNPAKVARAEDPHGPQKPVPDMEFWLHLDALKSLTDGCAQYADLINRHLQRDATTRATRLPSPLDEAERSAMLFADLNEPIPTEAKQAYEIRTRATEAEDDLQRQDGYRLAAEKFVALLQRIPDTDPRHSHLREEIAFCYMFSGNEELRARAEEIYGEILEADPNRARALLRLGQLRRDADDYAEAHRLMERGLKIATEETGPADPEAHRQLVWVLSRDLAFVTWRLTDLDPAAEDTPQLLRQAIAISEKALPLAPTDEQRFNTRQNLLYYLTDLWRIAGPEERESLRQRGKELLREVSEFVSNSKYIPTDELDTILRGEWVFGDPERAQRAAVIVKQRLREVIENVKAERGCLRSVAFEALSRDDQDIYLNADDILLTGGGN